MSIHKRVNKRKSVWIVRYRDPLPRERTFERKADAQRFERYVRHQLDTDQYLDPEMAKVKVTFAEWARRWWSTVESSERAPSTISGYESALRIQDLRAVAEAMDRARTGTISVCAADRSTPIEFGVARGNAGKSRKAEGRVRKRLL